MGDATTTTTEALTQLQALIGNLVAELREARLYEAMLEGALKHYAPEAWQEITAALRAKVRN